MKNAPKDFIPLYSLKLREEDMLLVYTLYDSYSDGAAKYALSVEVTGDGGDFELLPYIASHRGKAEEIFEAICRGRVTPCTLSDVMENFYD